MDDFKEIIEHAIEKANRVPVTIEEFADGLQLMIDELQICKEAAEGDMEC